MGSQTPNHNTKFNANKKRAENKDNLDSRENEEQQFIGGNMTHNRKEQKSRKSGANQKDKKDRH